MEHDKVNHLKDSSIRGQFPRITDGMRPEMQRILSALLAQNHELLSTKTVKVAAMAAMVEDSSAYHHGDEHLTDAILKVSREFTGSASQLNPFKPSAQFGCRDEQVSKSPTHEQ
jgi:DNA topoisomerase-2